MLSESAIATWTAGMEARNEPKGANNGLYETTKSQTGGY